MSQNRYVLLKTIGKMLSNILSKREQEIFLNFFLTDCTGWFWTSAMQYLGSIQASYKHPTRGFFLLFFLFTLLSDIYRILFLRVKMYYTECFGFVGALIPTELLCLSILQALRSFSVVTSHTTSCIALRITKSDFSCAFASYLLSVVLMVLKKAIPCPTPALSSLQWGNSALPLLLAFLSLSIAQSLSLPWFVDGWFC